MHHENGHGWPVGAQARARPPRLRNSMPQRSKRDGRPGFSWSRCPLGGGNFVKSITKPRGVGSLPMTGGTACPTFRSVFPLPSTTEDSR
jgi:hypothetical protein